MLLQLRRPSELESSLAQYIAELHNPTSPNFHQWLSAKQLELLTDWRNRTLTL